MTQTENPKPTREAPIRDAASVLVLRGASLQTGEAGEARVLMGRRAAKAAFMPKKFVFPGGAVDPEDGMLHAEVQGAMGLSGRCCARLQLQAGGTQPQAFYNAALRELREETGLILRKDAPLTFVLRAITPSGNARRFDARFFVACAEDVDGDLDDFAAAEDELSELHWVGLADALKLDLPRVTVRVLTHVTAALAQNNLHESVPFFDPDRMDQPWGSLD